MTIEVEGLSKKYGDRFAVKEATFTVQPGQVTGFLGPNGAGKSTTMRSIVGLDRPTSGTALIDGQRYADLRSPLASVGALLDAKSAHRSRTARNYLESVAATHRIPRRRVDAVLEMTGLTAVAKRKVGAFSLGMGQRLGIAAALLGDPRTLLLDEPVNGLDPEGVAWVRTLLRRLADDGRTVFLSSHLLTELELIVDHVIIIGRGTILADSPIDAFTHDRADRVRVRTTRIADLVRLLAAIDVTTTSREHELVEIEGVSAEHVARMARDADILLTELTPVRQTLEDAYTALTKEAVEYVSS